VSTSSTGALDDPEESGSLDNVDIVVDIVDDLDADPTGETDSDNALASIPGFTHSVAIRVPPGIYAFSGRRHPVGRDIATDASGPAEVHFVAADEGVAPPETEGTPAEHLSRPRFVAPQGFSDVWLDIAAREVTFDGIDIDRNGYKAGPQLRFRCSDSLLIRDCRVLDRDDTAVATGATFDVSGTRRSTLDIDHLSMPHGAWWPTNHFARRTDSEVPQYGRAGLLIGSSNQGHVKITDCEIAECSGHGIDVASSENVVTISGGDYRNNNGAQVRLTGSDHEIRNATVDIDFEGLDQSRTDAVGRVVSGIDSSAYSEVAGVAFARSATLSTTDPTTRTGTIRDSRVAVDSVAGETDETSANGGAGSPIARGAVVVGSDAGGPTVERCDLLVAVDEVAGFRADAPEIVDAGSETAYDVTVRQTSVDGAAQSGVAFVVTGRQGTFRGCIARPGTRVPADADGVTIQAALRGMCPRRVDVNATNE
jgi:hypothetical protein